jgi:hypothetical protein
MEGGGVMGLNLHPSHKTETEYMGNREFDIKETTHLICELR